MAWERIGYEVLGSAAASISISVPTPYDFYRCTFYIVNDANVKAGYLRFNADSGANYSYQQIYGQAASVGGGRTTGATQINPINIALEASETANFTLIVAKPAAGVKAQVVSQAGVETTAPGIGLSLIGGEWNNTAAEITSVALVASSNNFDTGSSLLLEGLSLS